MEVSKCCIGVGLGVGPDARIAFHRNRYADFLGKDRELGLGDFNIGKSEGEIADKSYGSITDEQNNQGGCGEAKQREYGIGNGGW